MVVIAQQIMNVIHNIAHLTYVHHHVLQPKQLDFIKINVSVHPIRNVSQETVNKMYVWLTAQPLLDYTMMDVNAYRIVTANLTYV